jgi:hypothetical protein
LQNWCTVLGLAWPPSARPVEEDPHRGLSGFDLRVVAVLQYLDLRDRALGEGLPDLLLDAIGHCLIHAILRQLACHPCGLPDNGSAHIRRWRLTFPPRNRTDRDISRSC